MGSPGIGKLIRRKASRARKEYDYSYYTGKALVIDLMTWLYRFKIAKIKQPSIKSINVCLWSKVINMLSNGILPIFVIDGKPPKLKRSTLDKRKKIKEMAKNKLKNLSEDDYEERLKLKTRCVYIKDSEIREALDFLNSLGFLVVQALEEADPQCAGINIAGKAYGVVSEDWDTLIFGAEKMITNFSRRKKIIEYDRDTVLSSLKVDQDGLVELAIILGCDYCDAITIIGGDRSKEVDILYEKYMHYGNLEKMLTGLRKENTISKKTGIKYKIPQNLSKHWKEIKSQFLKVEICDPRKKMNFKWRVANYSSLKSYLLDIDSKNVNQNIKKIRKLFNYYDAYGCLVNLSNNLNKKKDNIFGVKLAEQIINPKKVLVSC